MSESQNENLIRIASEARKESYSPYSGYPVGAALLGTSGEIYSGTNVENVINDLSICAERVALFTALSEGAREFEKLAVVCEGDYCMPCGACRQTLIEHAPDLEIIMANTSGDYEVAKLEELLPRAFTLED